MGTNISFSISTFVSNEHRGTSVTPSPKPLMPHIRVCAMRSSCTRFSGTLTIGVLRLALPSSLTIFAPAICSCPSSPRSPLIQRISVSIGRRDSYHNNPLISSGGGNSTFLLQLQREALDDETITEESAGLPLERPGWFSALACHGKEGNKEMDEDGREMTRHHLAEVIAPITDRDIQNVLKEGIHGSTNQAQHDFFCRLVLLAMALPG